MQVAPPEAAAEHPDEAVARIASAQRGLVTREQLTTAGVPRGAIAHRVSVGRLHRVHRGVYLVGHRALPPLARELAAVLACGPGAVLSHRSAAAVWSLGPAPGSTVELSVATRLNSRPGLRVHRVTSLDRGDLVRRAGLPVTTPLRTLLDLAGAGDRRATERALAEAMARSLVRRAQLLGALDAEPGRRGAVTLRALLEDGPALTRSEAERRLLGLVRRAGLPGPKRTRGSAATRSTRCGASSASRSRWTATPSTPPRPPSSPTAGATRSSGRPGGA